MYDCRLYTPQMKILKGCSRHQLSRSLTRCIKTIGVPRVFRACTGAAPLEQQQHTRGVLWEVIASRPAEERTSNVPGFESKLRMEACRGGPPDDRLAGGRPPARACAPSLAHSPYSYRFSLTHSCLFSCIIHCCSAPVP